eukprot:6893353-Alexandrium_andersonii.AAC.1
MQTDKQIDRQMPRQTDRQPNRQTDQEQTTQDWTLLDIATVKKRFPPKHAESELLSLPVLLEVLTELELKIRQIMAMHSARMDTK